MATETGFSREALLNEALKQFARSRGYGSARPLRVVTKGQMNKREIDAARAINRRVEFVVVEGSEGR